ncbi:MULTISPECIES: O-antigen ligase family protein [unclassified Acinetobacter]|uniref:O-antigen ligase family protein n=1 Tax=unclassified Acinetobacter TaxID=196816 RepID=UPI0035B78CB7
MLDRISQNANNVLRSKRFLLTLCSLMIFSILISSEVSRKIPNTAAVLIFIISLLVLLFNFKRWKTLSPAILFTCISFPLLVSIDVFLGGFSQDIPLLKTYWKASSFVFLPLLLAYSRFKVDDFGKLLLIFTGVSIFFNTIILFYFELNRMQIDALLRYVIIYDGMIFSLLACAMVYIYHIYTQNKCLLHYILMFCLILAMMLLLFHGTRALLPSLVIIPIYLICIYWKKAKLLAFVKCVAIILLLPFVFLSPYSSMQNRVQSINTEMTKYTHQQPSSSGDRLTMWELAIQDFKKSPILGQGLEGLKNTHCKAMEEKRLNACYDHAHSMYFHELSTHGILGFIGLLSIFFIPLSYFYRSHLSTPSNMQQRLAIRMGVVFVCVTMINSTFDYFLINTRFSIILYVFLVVLFMYWSRPQLYQE